MKKVILFVVGLCLSVFLNAQVSKTVNLTTAGSLTTTLTAQELATVTNLTLTGTIDASDFKTMRDNMPLLAEIDISGVTVAAYNGTEGTAGTGSISYPNNTIPLLAFQQKITLSSIKMPNSITAIGEYSFRNCSGLPSVIIPTLVTSIGHYAFYNCLGLSSVTFESASIISEIGIEAFGTCIKLTSINIPSTVKTIGQGAFEQCRELKAINIPSLVNTIGSQAFYRSNATITVDPNNLNYESFEGVLFSKGKTSIIYCPPTKSGSFAIPSTVTNIEFCAFDFCSNLTTITIPSGVTKIGGWAFAFCSGLTSIYIPSTVTNIGDRPFIKTTAPVTVDPSNLNYSSQDGVLLNKNKTELIYCPPTKTGSYICPSTITSIQNCAFYYCSILTSITIPFGITKIGDWVFEGCTGLTSIFSNSSTPVNLSSNNRVFYDVNKTTCALYVPFGSSALYRSANQWQDFTNIVEMAEFKLSANTATIAAPGGTAVVNLTTGLAWTAISDQTWLTVSSASGTGNNSFTFTATANSSITARIATVTISSIDMPSQTIVVSQAGAPKTLSVTAGGLASALTTEELASITNLILTGTIDARDFKTMRDNMPLLSEIDLSGVTIFAYTGTEGTYMTSSVDYPANEIPTRAFRNNETGIGKPTLVSAILPNSITSIGYDAFCNCQNLAYVNIPSLVTSLGTQAFQDCPSLTSIFIPKSLISIGSWAFTAFKGLFTVDAENPKYSSLDGVLFNKSKTILLQCPASITGNYNIPSSVISIGYQAFYSCNKLISVNIPNSVTSIENYGFYVCTGLTSIYVNSSNPINLSSVSGVFGYVNKTTCVLHVPYGSKAAYQEANQWLDFTNIVEMPEFKLSATTATISAIGGTAMVNLTTGLTWTASSDQIWLSISSVSGTGNTTLAFTATANSSLSNRIATVTISSIDMSSQTIVITQSGAPKTLAVTAGSLASALTAEELASITNLTLTGTIDARDFKTMRDDMPLLAEIDLSGVTVAAYTGTEGTAGTSNTAYPANTTPIYAFYNSSIGISKKSLTSAILPLNATDIGNNAFYNCTGLTSVILQSSVTTIGSSAFSSCSGLTSVTIPSSVKIINSGAFGGCSNLSTVSIPSSVTSIGSDAFNSCYKLASISIPSSVVSIGGTAFAYCSGPFIVDADNPNYSEKDGVLFDKLQTLLIQYPTSKSGAYSFPTSVVSIGFAAFVRCTNLSSVIIPSTVKSIGASAFSDCSGLNSVTIPTSIKIIEGSSFSSCTGLTSVTIPSSVSSIGAQAFYGCTGLTSVTIPSAVTSIGSGAFAYCSGLTTVNIPSSVSSIGSQAFYRCMGLSSIYVFGNTPVNLSSSSNAFYNVNKTSCNLYVPYGTKALYNAANQWQDFTNIIEMSGFQLSANNTFIGKTEGGTASVDMIANVNWSVSSNQSWLTVNPASGTGNATLVFTAQANPIPLPRIAKVTVSATGVESQTITITQAFTIQPLTGVKTINPVGGDFTSFTDAIAALNYNGVGAGGVTFMVAAGTTYNEAEMEIRLQTNTSNATNRIVFQKDGNGANPIIFGKKVGGTTSDVIIRIAGTDYITFDGIDLSSDPSATLDADKIETGYYFYGYNNMDGCNHVTIKNCDITIDRKPNADNQYGIYLTQSASSISGIHSNILIDNVKFLKGRTSIYSSANMPNETFDIRNCKFGELTTTIEPLDYGRVILLSNCKNLSFHNNEIQNIVGPDFYTLQISGLSGENYISNNKIHNLLTTSNIENSDLYVINSNSSDVNATINIYNNLIYNLEGSKATSTLAANPYWNITNLYLLGTAKYRVYNNTIIGNSTNPHENTIFCWATTTTEVKNNIFADFSAVGVNSFRSMFLYDGTIENNVLWIDETLTNNFINRNTHKFREWQKGSSKPSVGNYLSNVLANPNFNDQTNFDFSLKSPSPASNNAQPIGFITTDLNGISRNANTPDIGAIEGNFGPAVDLIPPVIRFQPIPDNSSDVVKLIAEITDNVKVAEAKVWYREKHSSTAFFYVQGAQYGNIWEFIFPTLTSGEYEYFICAKDLFGNISSNGYMVLGLEASQAGLLVNNPPANPDFTYSFSYQMPLPDIYNCTVGEGGNFGSLTRPGGLFDVLNSTIVNANIQVTIVSDLAETGEIALQQLRETGPGNYTLTIKPNSSALRIISNAAFTPISFIGTDRIRIDGSYNGDNLNHIKFECNNANPLKFINIDTNGCNDVSLRYCDFSSTTYACIFVTGTNHSNFTIDHVNSIKGYSGMSFNSIRNLSITNCTIGNSDVNNTITNYGTYLAACTNILIENNTIRNIINNTINAPAQGFYLVNITGGSVSKNIVINVQNNNTNGTGGSSGLFGATCKDVILSNNIFSGINGYGSGTTSASYGIKGVVFINCNGIKFWYNTVNLYGTGNTASGGRCYSLSTENSFNSEFCNNIFSNTITNSNTSYTNGISQGYRELTNIFKNNINYIGGSKASVPYTIQYDGGGMTFLTWRSYGFTPGNGRDLGSGVGDPKFTSSTMNDLSLLSDSPALNSGIPNSITNDFYGNIRSTTSPDIGAIEDNSMVLINDIIAPVISYVPYVNSLNTTPAFVATITDNSGVTAAKMWYRVKGSTDTFSEITGVKQEDNKTWNFSVSIPLIINTEYEYFICAKDAANNTITNGITDLALDAANVGLAVNNPAANPLYVRIFKVTDLSISLGAITGSPFMVNYTNGAPITIQYVATGTYSSNVFEAYLSDVNGSFGTELKIGSVISDVSGTINATIPAAIGGNNFRIRIKSTNPVGVISNISDAFQVVNDNTAPGVVITTTKISPISSPFTVSIKFSEAVKGFVQNMITVTNANLSNLSATVADKEFTVIVTPVNSGNVSVQVDANKVIDLAGNSNGSSNQINLTYIELDAPNLNISASDITTSFSSFPVKLTFTFNQDVTGFTSGDINVTNGSISNFAADPTFPNIIFMADLTPVAEGTVRISVADDIATNAASKGNSNATLNLVYALPHPPVAHAGPDQTVNEGAIITLDGSASSDVDNDALTYLWTAPAGITLSSGTIAKPTFTAPDVNSDTDFIFSLVVNDGTADSPVDQVVITVKNLFVQQDITLNTGWNIISANVTPANLDLKVIFQPLIDAGKLKKVMDEAGKTIENFGAFGGWKNNIGSLGNSEGYKVNVTAASTLSLEGTLVQLPFDIALNSGWNIISYPGTSSQDAKALVQSLIDAGKLKKVMDESGKTIENFGAFGGWKNNIGNFIPGKGYKVNVTANCILTIPASGTKSLLVLPELLASEHFKPAFKGNGTDHATINLVNLQASGLQANDEIGVFDGKFCVGSAMIGTEQLVAGSISIPVSANDGLEEIVNGFTEGHSITYKLHRNAREYTLDAEPLQNSKDVFVKGESSFAQIRLAIATGFDELSSQISIKCYPNPFSDRINIEIQLREPNKLEVTIYDLNGRLVRNLYRGQFEKGENLVWDGRNDQGIVVVSGIYYLKANDQIEKIVLRN